MQVFSHQDTHSVLHVLISQLNRQIQKQIFMSISVQKPTYFAVQTPSGGAPLIPFQPIHL